VIEGLISVLIAATVVLAWALVVILLTIGVLRAARALRRELGRGHE